jgi:hypothetical protein
VRAAPEWQAAGLWLVLLANGGAGLARLAGIVLGGASLGGYLGWALAWSWALPRWRGLALALRPA